MDTNQSERDDLMSKLKQLLAAVLLFVALNSTASELKPRDTPVNAVKPLLVIIIEAQGLESIAHDDNFYRSRIFGLFERSVMGYFWTVSRGNFTYREAAIVRIADDNSPEVRQAAGVVEYVDENNKGDRQGEAIRKRARYLAGSVFDYAAYDANNDGQVTRNELAILVIDNYSNGGGQTSHPACRDAINGVNVCASVSGVGHRADETTMAHELAHQQAPYAIDLYGYDACYSQGKTLMSCTGAEPSSGPRAFLLDPYHRAKFGWHGPSMTASARHAGNKYIVSAIQNPWNENEVLTVTSSLGDEAIHFEYRGPYTSHYDDQANGLYVWYSRLDDKGNPLTIPALRPKREDDKSDKDPTDRAFFTLLPSECRFLPNDIKSRGKGRGLAAGEYSMVWESGTTTFFIDIVRFDDGSIYYEISWNDGGNSGRKCDGPYR
jgi:M6 family metalloprotease-like protein